MRLLNVYSLEFREFHPSTIQSYVVASHLWVHGEEEEEEEREATFQDVKERQNTKTTGYQKILAFAEYIRAHMPDVEWLWIDTCCINKQDAQEVTESINSMFKWYHDAVVCLAYLMDVNTSNDLDSFAGSKWFKRGWTLQELLAPRTVIFLSQDWQVIGHKRCDAYREGETALHLGVRLNASITGITGIPEAVLSDFQRSRGLTIEERLAWMDSRRTTREEDMSYCLFGIFEAPIGANYGEGEDRARKRLLIGISKDNAVLETLLVASGAAFDDRENEHVSECLPDTRVDLLQDIDNWASSNNGACIFWLGGMAGTGKSTIFKTITRRFRDQYRLAASFCFKRGEADRGHALRLITTISAQLAQRLPNVRDKIVSALEKDSDIVRKGLREQFQKLILQPLEHFASLPAYGPAWVICIDALDECDEESDIGIIIDLLTRLKGLKSANFRLFVTSRPDLPLRLGFRSIPNDAHYDVRLEQISENVIEHDIAVYLRHKLAVVRSSFARLNGTDSLRPDWPGEDATQALIQMAKPLFIFAATVCRFLGEPDEDPEESLRIVLRHQFKASQLDRTYQPILDRLLRSKLRDQQERIVEEFQAVVGSIVVLAEPLSITGLSKLLCISEGIVVARLQRLHSVLDVPSREERSKPVRPLHLSFRDYLTDPDTREKTPFWIDEAQRHQILANRCLRFLSEHKRLKQDLCSIEKPGIRRAEINKSRVESSIAPDIGYACRYLVWHLVNSGERLRDYDEVHRFLQLHFLHWLEALSWLGRLSEAVAYISDMRSLVEINEGLILMAFLDDARRFVLRNRYIIDLAPLQIYSSALVFTPTQSIIRRQFEDKIPEWLCLRPQIVSEWTSEIQKLEGHESGITTAAFSPDGKIVVSGSTDKTVRLWNARTGEQMHILKGHSNLVEFVAFSSNGQVIASGSFDETVRLWNARTGEQRQTLEVHDNDVMVAAFSPDRRVVASASDSQTVQLWDARTGRQTQMLVGHNESVIAVAFSLDGQVVASGSRDKTVRLWDARTGKQTQKLIGHYEKITAVALSSDGKVVVSGSRDKTVQLWDRAGQQTHTLKGHKDKVTAVALSPDAQLVASASDDRTVRLWDARTGQQTLMLEGHEFGAVAVVFSPNGQVVASASHGGIVRLWDARTGNQTQMFEASEPYSIPAIAFSPDGQILASALDDQTVWLCDARTGQQIHTLEACDEEAQAVAFSADGQRVVLASSNKMVQLWDTRTGEQTLKIGRYDNEKLLALAFSSNGQVLASTSSKKMVYSWDAQTGKQTQKLEGHDNDITAVVLSPDGHEVASASYSCTVELWNARTGQQRQTFEGHDKYVTAVAFSPDGELLASASYDQTVRLWDARTGKQMQTFEGHDDKATAVAISTDRQVVASGSADKTVRLWDAKTGEQKQMLAGHNDNVTAVAFSPDGRLVASASDDQTVQLWDARTGGQKQTTKGHDDKVTAVAFSPDGQLVASISNDQTVRLWDALALTLTLKLELGNHDKNARTIVFSPDGQLIAAAVLYHEVKLWDTRTGEETSWLRGYEDDEDGGPVTISSDGQTIATGSLNRTVRLWNTTTAEQTHKLEGHDHSITAIAFSLDGQVVASASYDQTVRMWNTKTGEQKQMLKGHSSMILAVAFSPNGQLVASASQDKTVRLWNSRTGEQTQKLEGYDGGVQQLAFSSDGQVTALAWGTKVQLWNPRRQDQLQRIGSHDYRVGAVVFSPDGQLLASGSGDKTIRLWDPRIAEHKQTVGDNKSVGAIVCSADREVVASGSDKTVRLWDARTGEQMQTLQGHDGRIIAVALSSDGQVVVSASADKTVRLWNAKTGRQTQKFELHLSFSAVIAVSPDGQVIAAATETAHLGLGDDVQLWDARTSEQVAILKGHRNLIWAVAFSPDGRSVASSSADHTLRLWDAKTGQEIHQFNGVYVTQIAFINDCRTLNTDIGDFDIGKYVRASPTSDFPVDCLVRRGQWREWVGYRDKDILWLPHEYRGSCKSMTYGDTMVIGQQSGEISILRLSMNYSRISIPRGCSAW